MTTPRVPVPKAALLDMAMAVDWLEEAEDLLTPLLDEGTVLADVRISRAARAMRHIGRAVRVLQNAQGKAKAGGGNDPGDQ